MKEYYLLLGVIDNKYVVKASYKDLSKYIGTSGTISFGEQKYKVIQKVEILDK